MRALIGEPPRELDAEFDLNFRDDCVAITIHSRGGSVSRGNQTNPEYEILVQALLERLRAADSELREILLASRTVANLPRSQRRIEIEEFDFPVPLNDVADVTELRLAIRRAVVRSHSTSSNRLHGNATKKIEMVASLLVSPTEMVARLTNGSLSPDEPESNIYLEGRRVLRTHFRRERNQSLVRAAKSRFKDQHGRLYCEVCDFEFSKFYGQLGEDFIEAHHESPIAYRELECETKIEDLRMVCANCHRMLHRMVTADNFVSVEQLKGIVYEFRYNS